MSASSLLDEMSFCSPAFVEEALDFIWGKKRRMESSQFNERKKIQRTFMSKPLFLKRFGLLLNLQPRKCKLHKQLGTNKTLGIVLSNYVRMRSVHNFPLKWKKNNNYLFYRQFISVYYFDVVLKSWQTSGMWFSDRKI